MQIPLKRDSIDKPSDLSDGEKQHETLPLPADSAANVADSTLCDQSLPRPVPHQGAELGLIQIIVRQNQTPKTLAALTSPQVAFLWKVKTAPSPKCLLQALNEWREWKQEPDRLCVDRP
jgi:hypothetical protein